MERGSAISTSILITGRKSRRWDLKDHLRALSIDLTGGDLPALSI